MANPLLAVSNRIGDVVLATSCTLADGTYTVTRDNMKDAKLVKVARTTTCKRLHTRVRGAFDVSYSIRAFALAYHNLSSTARVRLRAGRAALDLLFDGEETDILDSRLTKSGGTNGTRVNSRGFIVPVTATNMALQSQTLGNASWTKTNTTVTDDAVAAPDATGTTTAERIVSTAASGEHSISQAITTVAGHTYTFSVHVRGSNTEAGGYDWVMLDFDAVGKAWFNVKTGEFGSISGTLVDYHVRYTGSASEDAYAPIWYRVQITVTAGDTSSLVKLHVVNADGVTSYTGSTSRGIYAWGVQVQEGGDSTDYIVTTTTTASATTSGRINYGARRENLLIYSEALATSTWTTNTGSSVAANSTVAPDGQTTADTITFSSNAASQVYQPVTLQANTTYTLSVWAKVAASTSAFRFKYYDGVTGDAFSSDKSVTTTWQRFSYTWTTGTVGSPNIAIANKAAGGAASVIFWGAQLEKASTAGYYLPTTTAARVDLAPWRTNEHTYSELLETSCTQTACTLWPNETTAPDGESTARKLVENTAAAEHYSTRAFTSLASSTYTYSVHLKAGERTRALVALGFSGYGYAATGVDLSTGTLFTKPGGLATGTAVERNWTIEAEADGWYRVSVSGSSAGTSAFSVVYLVSSGTTTNYTGDGESGVYMWGAQLERYIESTPYIATTTQARTVADECLGLLVEEARTNSALRSAEFDNASWIKNAIAIAANDTLSPDGTTTADKFTTSAVFEACDVSQNVAIANDSTRYAWSVFVKIGTLTSLQVRLALTGGSAVAKSVRFNLVANTATVNEDPGAGYFGIEKWGNGWYRCWVSAANNTTGNTNAVLQLFPAPYDGASTGTLYLFGGQFEAGAFPTSYIPTTSAAVTRAVDSVYDDVISDWLNAGAGTIYAECSHGGVGISTGIGLALDDTSVNNVMTVYYSLGKPAMYIASGGAATVNDADLGAVGAVMAGTTHRLAMAYQSNDAAGVCDGGTVDTDSTVTLPTVTRATFGSYATGVGHINGHIKRVTYFPERLKNSELVTLTTDGPDALGYSSDWFDALEFEHFGDVESEWGLQYPVMRDFEEAIDSRYFTLEIDDVANETGYLDLGRLGMFSMAFQPEIGPEPGWKDGREDLSTRIEMTNGRIVGTERRRRRVTSFNLPCMDLEEGRQVHEFMDVAGTLGEVLYIPDPDDMATSQRLGGLCHLRSLQPVDYPVFQIRSVPIELVEKL